MEEKAHVHSQLPIINNSQTSRVCVIAICPWRRLSLVQDLKTDKKCLSVGYCSFSFFFLLLCYYSNLLNIRRKFYPFCNGVIKEK